MQKKKTMLTVLLLGAFLFGFAVWGAIKPADAQSQSAEHLPFKQGVRSFWSMGRLTRFCISGFKEAGGCRRKKPC